MSPVLSYPFNQPIKSATSASVMIPREELYCVHLKIAVVYFIMSLPGLVIHNFLTFFLTSFHANIEYGVFIQYGEYYYSENGLIFGTRCLCIGIRKSYMVWKNTTQEFLCSQRDQYLWTWSYSQCCMAREWSRIRKKYDNKTGHIKKTHTFWIFSALSTCVIFSKWRQEYNSLNHWLIFTLLIFCHESAIIHLACDKHCSEKIERTWVNCIYKILFIWSLTSSQNSSSRAADWIQECVDIINLSVIFLNPGFGKRYLLLESFFFFFCLT